MITRRIKILLDKYRAGKCTADEEAEIIAWYNALDTGEQLELPKSVTDDWEAYRKNMYVRILEKARQSKVPAKRHTLSRWSRVAAAVLILVTAAAAAFYIFHRDKPADYKNTALVQDIAPGRDGAILTLADGSTVLLDSSGNGIVATEGTVQVTSQNGQLAYSGHSTAVVYNTLSTPRARQYSIILPDGTKVWLNAASSIKYPVAFTGGERKVSITGEAYFEVAHNAAMPFKVTAGNAEIMDIGTSFNVSAYGDEPLLKTTLLEGAVSVNKKVLKPGEQAQTGKDNDTRIVALPNADEAIAWKSGRISFDDVDVPTLMRQLSRWYDITIQYEGSIPQKHLLGSISRKTSLSVIVNALRENDIHCSIEGNKLIVAP